MRKNIIDTSDYVEVNKTDYEIKGNHNPFRFILIDLFRYHRSNTYKHNPVHNFFEEHFEEVITDAQQRYFDGINKNEKPEWENSFLIPPKEELVKILAAVDAYDNFNKEIHLQSVSNMSVKSTLNKWFAAGETERVVEALQSIAERYGDQYFQNDVTHQTGRFNGVKNQYKNGLISDDFYNREINKIRHALQYLIDKIPTNATLNIPDTPQEQAVPLSSGNAAEAISPQNDNTNAQTPIPNQPLSPTKYMWISGIGFLYGEAIMGYLFQQSNEWKSKRPCLLHSAFPISIRAAAFLLVLCEPMLPDRYCAEWHIRNQRTDCGCSGCHPFGVFLAWEY
ncbi:MAG: hypothetical protein IPJ74_26630 [Saprospiraceae bacterium]|nr:hypothetical protein [Saprospiraceae bacterium]